MCADTQMIDQVMLTFSPMGFSCFILTRALHMTSSSLLERKPSPSLSKTLKQTAEKQTMSTSGKCNTGDTILLTSLPLRVGSTAASRDTTGHFPEVNVTVPIFIKHMKQSWIGPKSQHISLQVKQCNARNSDINVGNTVHVISQLEIVKCHERDHSDKCGAYIRAGNKLILTLQIWGTSLLFVNATSQFCDILASRRSAVDYIDVKNLQKWLIPVSAVATACCTYLYISIWGLEARPKVWRFPSRIYQTWKMTSVSSTSSLIQWYPTLALQFEREHTCMGNVWLSIYIVYLKPCNFGL